MVWGVHRKPFVMHGLWPSWSSNPITIPNDPCILHLTFPLSWATTWNTSHSHYGATFALTTPQECWSPTEDFVVRFYRLSLCHVHFEVNLSNWFAWGGPDHVPLNYALIWRTKELAYLSKLDGRKCNFSITFSIHFVISHSFCNGQTSNCTLKCNP